MSNKRRYEFAPKTRKLIYARENYKCVMPNCNQGMLGVAHIFHSRAKGGLGVKENGVLMCQEHHHALDNGRDGELANKIQAYCESYLRSHYDINANELVYNKWNGFKYAK